MARKWGGLFNSFFQKTIAILVFLALWEIVPRLGLVDKMYLPPFTEVVAAFIRLILSGELFLHIAASMERSLIGLMLAAILAIPLGILVGWFGKFERIIDPLLQLFRNTSTLALLPVFIIFFGLGEVSKIAIIFWGTLWPMLLNTISGVKDVDPLLIKSAKSMGISNVSLLGKVVLPSATPSIITGFRLSAAVSVMILVAAEMLGANQGLGFLIFYSEQKYDIPEMFSGVVSISLLGVIINYLIVTLEKRLTGWKEQI